MRDVPEQEVSTAEALLALPDGYGECYELVDGVLEVREPPGTEHGFLEANLAALLVDHVRRHRLGRVLAGDPGFFTRGDRRTVRAPDLAFLSYRRFPPGPLPRGYCEVAPDLVVEILSPWDSPADVARRVREWLDFGALAVWLVDPTHRAIRVHSPARPPEILGPKDLLQGGQALPRFRVPVGRVFED